MTEKSPSQAPRVKTTSQRSILLQDYMQQIAPTDELPQDNLHPILLGLFGEVGSVMATAKKLHREGKGYAGYQHAMVEELGDVLWYFTTLCRRLGYQIEDVLSDVTNGEGHQASPSFDELLLKLGAAAAALLTLRHPDEKSQALLRTFADQYLQAVQTSRVTFDDIVLTNTDKARGRFLEPDWTRLPTFDSSFLDEERLPLHFKIKITQRKGGQSYLQWNGVFIGDPLTDNICDPDGYRFHDVFHFAHAAILHWSPTFRALIKQKRKSDPRLDETQDGGRAIVVEEGLTAWIFSRAKHLNFFDGQDRLSFDLLKTIQQFVQGYEVENCPLKLWERTILNGYAVFREVLNRNGGIVVGDREARTITYEPIEGVRE